MNNSFDVILGQPFLCSRNPLVDWRNKTLTIRNMHSKSESINQLGSTQERCIIALNVAQNEHTHAHEGNMHEGNISTHPKDDIDMLLESVVAESQ